MNDPSSQGDVPKDSKNHPNKGAPAPRKFVFNTYHTDFKENDPREFFKNSKNPMFMRHIPVINEFPEPRDLKEAYRNICEVICSAYNDVRDLVLRETTEHIKDILKNIKVEGPGDCIKFMRAIAIKCYEKSKEADQSDEMNKTAQDYEKLLQKSELKIREMIRNEQIYRISFDQYALKDEELERTISELNSKLEENREVLESYAKESAQLRALLHQKEEDIRTLAIEKESFLQKLVTPQSSNKPKTPENLRSETHRPKAHSLASQNLKTFLKNNSNLASSEALDLVYNVDLTKFLNASKKSNSKTPRTSAGTAKAGHSSAALDVTHGTLKTLKLNDLDKTREMRESVKNPGEIPTDRDRKKLEMSGEQTATNSSRLVEWHNYVRSSKRPSSQKLGGVSDATSKSRSPSHVKFRRESNHYEGEEKEKTITPGKVRQAEDLQASKIKTDGSDDRSSKYVFIDRVEKGRAGDVDHRPKLSMSQAISSGYKRRSGGLKSRPEVADFITNSHERSAEQKSFIINSKYPATHGASVITYRSTSKGRIPLAEHKDNKNTKTNISLMNLMLKKLAEQKSHSKKDLLH